jgi:integrase
LDEWGNDTGHLTLRWLTGRAVRKGGPLARRKGAQRQRRLSPDVLDEHGNITETGEERRLLAVAGEWLQRVIIAALETGCRKGELLSLQWQDVSLARGLITVRAEKAKTRTTRHIPISPRLRAVLDLVKADLDGHPHPPLAYVFGNGAAEQILFPKKAWETCVLKAHGHPPEWTTNGSLSAHSRTHLGTIDLHFHDLRHEAGSRLADNGWPLHHVQRVLGHADLKMTSTYLNASIRDLQASMQQFGTGKAPQALHTVEREHEAGPPPPGNAVTPPTAKPLVN